jgi:hypothetical protein
LAAWTKKRRALGLDNPDDHRSVANLTDFTRAIINAVLVLVAAIFVEDVAIRSIAECGTFVLHRQFQDLDRRRMDPQPLGDGQTIARPRGMNLGQVQNLGRVQIADSGHGRLIEERDLDWAAAPVESLAKDIGRDLQRIGSDAIRAVMLFELAIIDDAHDS